MEKKQYGLTAQGEPLPKFQDVGLSDSVRNGTMRAAATLSKWRHGWRIKHPKALNNCENMPHFPKLRPLRRGSIQFRGMGREPKKTPPLCLPT